MFLSQVFIAQGCGDSDPCGDSGHCGIRIKSFGTLFVSAPLCGDSDLCDPDRNQGDVETVYGEGAEAEGEVVELWNVVFGVVWSSS